MEGRKLRQRRIAARIPGRLLCMRAKLQPSRLSAIEREYAAPREDEWVRLTSALDELIAARRKVEELAAEVGYPLN